MKIIQWINIPPIAIPTNTQLEKINEHLTQDHYLYERNEASNEKKSTAMDWSVEKASCGSISDQKSNFNFEHEHNHVEAVGVCMKNDYDMGRDGKCCSKTEPVPKKSLNPPAKRLRTNTLLNFVKVMPKAPNNFSSKFFAREPKPQDYMITSGLTGKVKKAQIDTRNVFCPLPGCRNWGGRGF